MVGNGAQVAWGRGAGVVLSGVGVEFGVTVVFLGLEVELGVLRWCCWVLGWSCWVLGWNWVSQRCC